MKTKKTYRVGGLSFSTALALLFITLKLCHVIDWSWPWVLSPLWILPGLILGTIALILAGTAFVAGSLLLLEAFRSAKRR